MALVHHVKLTTAEMMTAHSREFTNYESKFRRRLTLFNQTSLYFHKFKQCTNLFSKCQIINILNGNNLYEYYRMYNQVSWFEQLLQQTIDDIDRTGGVLTLCGSLSRYTFENETKGREREFEHIIDLAMEPFINEYVGYKVYNVFEEKKIIDMIEDATVLHRPLCCIVFQYVTECM